MKEYIEGLGKKAKAAAAEGAALTTDQKNNALRTMAKALRDQEETILKANEEDMKNGEEKGLTPALLDRLKLNHDRIEGMAGGLEALAALNDPIGETIAQWKRPNGLEIARKRVPLGVIAII